MSYPGGFVDALLAAPLGVAWLAQLEAEVRPDIAEGLLPRDSRPVAVAAASEAVRHRPLGELLALAVQAGYLLVGPWVSWAPQVAAAAYRAGPARRPIAEAIEERFGADLHQPVDRDAQQWWHDGERSAVPPLFQSFDHVYGAGQFTWSGLWTTNPAPDAIHADMLASWEYETGPVSRWRLPARGRARVVEIHRPEDWAALVRVAPAPSRPDQESWELPGANQRTTILRDLLDVPGQRAARGQVRRHLVPDWGKVAAEHDGVHLSWAGFLTSEGCVTDLGGGDVAMLRYWFSERTLWLRDVFGPPEPLGAPDIDERGSGLRGADARADRARQERDRADLGALLSRPV
jgi:hypothetical protein